MVHRLLADGIFLLNFQVHLGTLVHLPVSQLLANTANYISKMAACITQAVLDVNVLKLVLKPLPYPHFTAMRLTGTAFEPSQSH